jgi:hypothetical protein
MLTPLEFEADPASAAPHSLQNLRSGALLPPQLEQTTRASYESPTLRNGTHRRGRRDSLWCADSCGTGVTSGAAMTARTRNLVLLCLLVHP